MPASSPDPECEAGHTRLATPWDSVFRCGSAPSATAAPHWARSLPELGRSNERPFLLGGHDTLFHSPSTSAIERRQSTVVRPFFWPFPSHLTGLVCCCVLLCVLPLRLALSGRAFPHQPLNLLPASGGCTRSSMTASGSSLAKSAAR